MAPHEHEAIEKAFLVERMDSDQIDRIRAMIGPFILRRRKEDVLGELPAKVRTVISCSPTDSQKAVYERAKDEIGDVENMESIAFNLTSNQLSNLRKIANHPMMCRVRFTDEKIEKMASLAMRELDFVDCKLADLIEVPPHFVYIFAW